VVFMNIIDLGMNTGLPGSDAVGATMVFGESGTHTKVPIRFRLKTRSSLPEILVRMLRLPTRRRRALNPAGPAASMTP
jgi:hypothetical protein